MYTIDKIDLLKSDIRTAVQTWGENKIESNSVRLTRVCQQLLFILKEDLKTICLNLTNKYQAMWMLQCFLLQTKTET